MKRTNLRLYLLVIMAGWITACISDAGLSNEAGCEQKILSPIDSLLHNAYKKNSKILLEAFFTSWHNSELPIQADAFALLDDTTKAIFEIYQNFFNPYDTIVSKNYKLFNEVYGLVRYVVVQETIVYSIAESLTSDTVNIFLDDVVAYGPINRIFNFRPKLNFDSGSVLYLTKEYEDGLLNFLTNTQCDSNLSGDPDRRMNFLSDYIHIISGSYYSLGKDWIVETSPLVGFIFLEKSLTRAFVVFWFYGNTLLAYMQKNSESWRLIDIYQGPIS